MYFFKFYLKFHSYISQIEVIFAINATLHVITEKVNLSKNLLTPGWYPALCTGYKSWVGLKANKIKADSLKPSRAVWRRLEQHSRCYSLINNSVCQGWASSSPPLWGPVRELLYATFETFSTYCKKKQQSINKCIRACCHPPIVFTLLGQIILSIVNDS